MATIEQCKFCSRPFHSIGGRICQDCLEKIDEDFLLVRDYIYDHPGSLNIDSICEATEVQKKVVLYLLEEKRLALSGPVSGGLTCSICHRPISDGSMCESCKQSLASKLGSSLPKPPPLTQGRRPTTSAPAGRSPAKMHIRRDDDKTR